jgi:SagB-type dehydrogenase family enzyme
MVLHRRSLAAQVRRWLLGRPAPLPPTAARGTPAEAAPKLSRRRFLWPGLSLAAGAGLGRWTASRAAPLTLEPGDDLGQVYHQWSKPSYAGLLAKSFHARPQPSPYKEYPGAADVPLPAVPPPGGPPFELVIARRRSVREYADRPLTPDELSRLLHAGTGITDRRDPTFAFRAVPSSGALFPIEVYPVVFKVQGVPPGAYHYDVQRHRLELVRAGDWRREVFQAALSQEMIQHCSLVLVLAGLFERVQWKYADRSYRYILLEAGHLGQNVYLAATALGLGPCGIGAFFDDDLNRLLGIDGRDEAAVYLLALGAAPG